MYRGNSSRIFPIILVLVIIAIVIVVLVSVGRAVFFGGGSAQIEPDPGREALLSTDAGSSVSMTVRGPIVANEEFNTYRITVSPNNRNMTVYAGYLERVTETKELGNNTRAYEEFVYALDKANYMRGEAATGEDDDTRGICATGRVYEFAVMDSESTVKRLWTSTCDGSPGSFRASVEQVGELFWNQIPDSDELLSRVDL